MKNILVVGETCKDIFVYGHVDRISPEAPIPVLQVETTEEGDGMAGNVVGNIKSLNPNFNVISYHNEDPIIKTRYVDTKSNYVLLRADYNDRIDRPALITEVRDLIGNTKLDAIIFSDYDKGFLKTSFIYDLSYEYDDCIKFLDTKKRLGLWAKHIDFVKINEKEYQNNLNRCPELRAIKNLIVTLGDGGAKYIKGDNGIDKFYDVPPIESPDVSGAGDTFLAGLCIHYLNTSDIDSSINFANRCANAAVSRKGVVQVKGEWIS